VVSVYPVSLGVLKPPGEYGADIAVGEGQSLGNRPCYGGPGVGFFASREKYVRRMPGRLVGETVDEEGNRGYVLTLQTREQHIRRERATSNICSNQALNALAAAIHLSLLGKQGLRQVAEQCLHKAHYAEQMLTQIEGVEVLNKGPFFNEFVLQLPLPADRLVQELLPKGVIPGVPLGIFDSKLDRCLLVAVTEVRTREEISKLVACIQEVVEDETGAHCL